MPPTSRPQEFGWRAQVKNWLPSLVQHQEVHGRTWRDTAESNKGTFPKSLLITIIKLIVPALAVRLVKSALRDAATALNIGIDDESIGVIADVVVAVL